MKPYMRLYEDDEILDHLRAWHRAEGSTPTKIQWERCRPRFAPNEFTIRSRFGSWNGAILAAGLEPNNVGRKRQHRG